MGLFSRLFGIFERNKAHPDLQEAYSQLNDLADILNRNIQALREIQKELVSRKVEYTKYSTRPTHALRLEKTLFTEEGFLKELKMLVEVTEGKFAESMNNVSRTRTVSKVEMKEILMVIDVLEKIKNLLPSLDHIQMLPDEEKLRVIEDYLRETTRFFKEFNELEALRSKSRKIGEKEISLLLKTIYLSPEHHPREPSLLFYRVTSKQLMALETEGQEINGCNDHNYKIEWRRWWRDIQIFEKDKMTPLKDPHVNVTVKLFGGPKRNIHLLLKEAA